MFAVALMRELMGSLVDRYGADNWDFDRFGPLPEMSLKSSIIGKVNKYLKRKELVIMRSDIVQDMQNVTEIENHIDGLSEVYELLGDEYSRSLLVKIIAYRLMGFRRVKLPLSNPDYFAKRRCVESLIGNGDVIDIEFNGWKLHFFELSPIGLPIKLYSRVPAVLKMFILKQYEYGRIKRPIKARSGDYVIDAGGCWGDTALHFAQEVQNEGKVFTFELIPSNIDVMLKNFSFNEELGSCIEVMPCALWSESGIRVFCDNKGPGSRVSDRRVNRGDVQSDTLSIDDFVVGKELPKVSFIKMDIEGAELYALRGAVEILKKFKPKLAISIYHSLDDFVQIPMFLSRLDLGYVFYIDHFSIHAEETVLFAEVP